MYLSQSAFAKYIKTTRQTVNNLVKDGIIETVNKKINVEKSIEKLKSEEKLDENNKFIPKQNSRKQDEKVEANIFDYPSISDSVEQKSKNNTLIFEEGMKRDEAKKNDVPLEKIMNKNINAMSKNDVERVKLYWQGMQERVKYEKEMGELVSKDEVYEEHFKTARTVRDAFLGLSNRVAHKLLNRKEIFEISSVLDAEVQKILENLSR